jgi:hypothetical protein
MEDIYAVLVKAAHQNWIPTNIRFRVKIEICSPHLPCWITFCVFGSRRVQPASTVSKEAMGLPVECRRLPTKDTQVSAPLHCGPFLSMRYAHITLLFSRIRESGLRLDATCLHNAKSIFGYENQMSLCKGRENATNCAARYLLNDKHVERANSVVFQSAFCLRVCRLRCLLVEPA